MALRTENVQVRVDFITDESRNYAKTIIQTEKYNKLLKESQVELAKARKELEAAGKDEVKRAAALEKVAAAEKKVAENARLIAEEAKKVAAIDLTKLTPAQLVERAKQLSLAMRGIPQSSPEFKQLQGELAKVNGQLKLINATAKGISAEKGGGLLQNILGVAGGVGLVDLAKNAIGSIINFGRQALAEADAQLKADAQIKEAIRSTGGVAGKSLDELKKQAEELQKVTLFGDDQTEGAQALLLTFKNIRGEIFDQTVPIVQDLATAFKQDLSSSAIQVGKALEDPIRGVTALRRVGITFSADQQAMIKSLVETGRTADAQRIILKELESQVGGSARAAAKAGAGGFQQLALVFGELKESFGNFIISISGDLVSRLKDFGNTVLEFVNGPQKTLQEQTEDLQVAFNNEIEVLLRGNFTQDERARLIGEINKKYKDYLPNLIDEKASLEDIAKAQRAANDEFAQKILFIALEEEIAKVQADAKEAAETAFAAERQRGKLRQDARKKEVQDVGAYTDFLAEQDKSLAALREGGLGAVRETPQRIAEIEQQFGTLAASLGTTVAELRKKFATKTEGAATLADGLLGDPEAAQGSLAFLRDQISDLQKQIDNTPGDSKLLTPLVEQLKVAEAALASLEEKLKNLKNPPTDAPPSDEEIARQLGLPTKQQTDKLTEGQRVALTEFGDFRIEEEQLTTDEINRLRDGLSDEDARRRREALAAEEDLEKEKRDLKFSAAESVADAIFGIEQNRIQNQTDEALSALDQEYQAKIKAAEGNSALQARLQKELETKKAAIEQEAAKKRKALALKEAVVQGALAVIKALATAGPFAAAAAGIAAAAQIAIILSQKFARGGFTGGGYGSPDETGFRPAGIVHEGEYVVPKRIVQDRRMSPVLQLLEHKRLRGFATGGFVDTTPVPIPTTSGAQVQDTGVVQRMEAAASVMLEAAQMFPTEVKSRVVYTEIEEVGTELNAVRDDAAI